MTANMFVVNRNNALQKNKNSSIILTQKQNFQQNKSKTYLGPALSSTFGIVCRKIVNMAAQKQAKSE